MFTRKAKDNRNPLYWGTGILTILGAVWARLKDVEIALSLFELITINQLGNNTMAYLDILIILILGGLILGIIHLWYKSKDEKAKREDFIKTIKKLHGYQTTLIRAVQNENEEEENRCVNKINELKKRLDRHANDYIVNLIRLENEEKQQGLRNNESH